MFLKDVNRSDISKKCTFSYVALTNYLTRHSSMKICNIQQVFYVLDFDFLKGLNIAQNIDTNMSRVDIAQILINEIKKGEA